MPPRKKTTNHRAKGGKHISSIDEVMERNAREQDSDEEGKGGGKGYTASKPKAKAAEEGSSEEASGDEKAKPKATAKKTGLGGGEVSNPNATRRNEDVEGVELTRKQREEIDKAAAQRRYQELHKQGKTDEAKADLARLEEVKKRREEAAKKRAEEEAKAKEAEAEKNRSRGMAPEVKDALGGKAARTGARVKNDVNLYSYVDGAGEKPADKPTVAALDGSIESCRNEEDDFM